jgi:hypothetical protein
MGYEKVRITPYIHTMVYHVLKFMCLHNGIKKFTGQGKDGTIKSVFTNTK